MYGEAGGWVSIRGLVCCVEARLFPWMMATWGRRPFLTVSRGLRRRQAVFRFQTLSHPLLDFIPLNILLKHQNPNHHLHLLDHAVFRRASFSVLLSNSPLSWAGKEERRKPSSLSVLPASLVLFKRQQLGAHAGPRGGAAALTCLPLNACWRSSPHVLGALPTRESSVHPAS